jgi:thiol-disulfide isomerase/thioredoxin
MNKSFLKMCGIALAVIAAVAVMASCGGKNSDNRYTISGNVPANVTAEWIYLYDVSGAEPEPAIIDSARIENGKFCFKGVAGDTVVMAVVHPGSQNDYPALAWTVLIEKGDIVVDTASMCGTGTPLNDGFNDWMMQLQDIFMTAEGPDELKTFFDRHWQEHSSDFVGTYVLSFVAPMLEFSYVDSLASQIPAEMRGYAAFKPFFEQLEAMRKMQPGQMFTDVEIAEPDGNAVKLSDYVGKGEWVLVDFWASWCGPCRQATPALQAVVKKHKSLKAIGIAVSDKLEDTKKAVKDLGIKWIVLIDEKAVSAKTYGINAIPAMILFAPDGKIAARDFNVDTLDDLLDENSIK